MIQKEDNYGDNIRRPDDIDIFAKEITDTLDDIAIPEKEVAPSKVARKHVSHEKHVAPERNTIMKPIPEFLREPLLIFIIYMILSLDIVKKTLSKYIPQIKPTADGGVMIIGVAIYGMILGVIYVAAKKLLL